MIGKEHACPGEGNCPECYAELERDRARLDWIINRLKRDGVKVYVPGMGWTSLTREDIDAGMRGAE